MEQIFAHPVSQPSRAVTWLCKLNNHAIEYKTVNTAKGESRSEAFKKINPMGKIPVLKDGDFILTESHAIILYLVEKHGWESWYPKDPKTRARINEYLHWHHHNARMASQIFFNQVMVNVGRSTPAIEASLKQKDKMINGILKMLEHWLRNGNQYIMTQSKPSIADISCYNEVVQLEVMGLIPDIQSKFPKTAAWFKLMKKLPYHDEELAAMMKFFHKFNLIPSKV